MKPLIALALAFVSLPAMAQSLQPATADTASRTPGGANYTMPKDWLAKTGERQTVLSAPEGNLRMVIIEVGPAADAPDAARKAWSLYRPADVLVVRLATPDAPQSGWDERVAFSYDTPPNAKLLASALALRKGANWTVLIADGALAAVEKRMGAVSLLQQSLHPAGYVAENFAGKAAHRLTPERIAALRDFLAQAARELEVPGIGAALVDQGKVVWQGGVGVRALGSPAPVTAHTKFMIASNTKGMSTLLLSALADEGKLRWNQPVTELYPEFRLGDDATTRSTLVRHLVCACTGLPRKDYAFILGPTGLPASDTFRQLSETQPTSKFGELFQYNNLMASAAGYLGGRLAYPRMEIGAAFDKAMQTRIFGPLKMRDTTFDNAIGMRGDWARPHGRDVEGRVVTISNAFNETIGPYRPAGGAWSSAADMARYVQIELAKGVTPEGKRLISETNILERRKPGVQVGEGKWYGMGLFNETDWGVKVVDHGGTLLGYRSNFYVLPEAGIGAVLLTNADDGSELTEPFLRRLIEVAYDGEPLAMAQVKAAAASARAAAKARRERLAYPGDPAVLANLAQRYSNPEIGELTLRPEQGRLTLRAGSIIAAVATRRNADGTVSLVSVGPGAIGVEAVIGTSPAGRTLTVRDSQHEYVYTEVR